MLLTEQHQISKSHILYDYCLDKCRKAKAIYNLGNYLVRQELETNGLWIRYGALDKIIKQQYAECYYEVGNLLAQQTLMLLDRSFKSYFASIKDWSKNPSKYKAKPEMPMFKKKDGGLYSAYITGRNVKLKKDVLHLPKLKGSITYKIPTKITGVIKELRINPKLDIFVIDVVYDNEVKEPKQLSNTNYAGIDLGLNNLATVGFNKGQVPLIVSGKPVKSINQFYNKKLAGLKSKLPTGKKSSKAIRSLALKRNNKVKNYFHRATKKLAGIMKENNVSKVVVGHNSGWKNNINLGKKTNQKFVQLPFGILISQLEYKLNQIGVNLIAREESYTSKASFLDNDHIPNFGDTGDKQFSGTRIKRGIYKSKDNKFINADVNGCYNILRKELPKAFVNGIEGVVVHPVRLKV